MKKTYTPRIALILAGFGLAATAATAQDNQDQAPEPAPELKALADSCSAHKFETMVTLEGRSHGSRVRICGEPGQSDADWLNTLRSSIQQTEGNSSLSQSVKDQIVAALNAEIARLDVAPKSEAIATIALPEDTIAMREPTPEYSSLPPLPTPKRAAPVRLSNGKILPADPVVPLVRPDLTLRCSIPHEEFAACARLERESQLLVRAGADMPPGTLLRFSRGGDNRAELDLSALKKGDTLRERLPTRVCSGVLRGKVQVEVVTKGRVAETMGPYALYCGS